MMCGHVILVQGVVDTVPRGCCSSCRCCWFSSPKLHLWWEETREALLKLQSICAKVGAILSNGIAHHGHDIVVLNIGPSRILVSSGNEFATEYVLLYSVNGRNKIRLQLYDVVFVLG